MIFTLETIIKLVPVSAIPEVHPNEPVDPPIENVAPSKLNCQYVAAIKGKYVIGPKIRA